MRRAVQSHETKDGLVCMKSTSMKRNTSSRSVWHRYKIRVAMMIGFLLWTTGGAETTTMRNVRGLWKRQVQGNSTDANTLIEAILGANATQVTSGVGVGNFKPTVVLFREPVQGHNLPTVTAHNPIVSATPILHESSTLTVTPSVMKLPTVSLVSNTPTPTAEVNGSLGNSSVVSDPGTTPTPSPTSSARFDQVVLSWLVYVMADRTLSILFILGLIAIVLIPLSIGCWCYIRRRRRQWDKRKSRLPSEIDIMASGKRKRKELQPKGPVFDIAPSPAVMATRSVARTAASIPNSPYRPKTSQSMRPSSRQSVTNHGPKLIDYVDAKLDCTALARQAQMKPPKSPGRVLRHDRIAASPVPYGYAPRQPAYPSRPQTANTMPVMPMMMPGWEESNRTPYMNYPMTPKEVVPQYVSNSNSYNPVMAPYNHYPTINYPANNYPTNNYPTNNYPTQPGYPNPPLTASNVHVPVNIPITHTKPPPPPPPQNKTAISTWRKSVYSDIQSDEESESSWDDTENTLNRTSAATTLKEFSFEYKM